jgi:hypothetical protein
MLTPRLGARCLTGALLTESLATGKGLGFAVTQAASQLQYDTVWAMVVVTHGRLAGAGYPGPGAGARGEREPRCHRTVTGSVQKGPRCAI